MNCKFIINTSKACVIILLGLLCIPAVAFALDLYAPDPITYDSVSGKVRGTVYSYQPEITIDFRNQFGGLQKTVGTFSASKEVNGYDQSFTVNEFDIDADAGSNLNPDIININAKFYNHFNKISVNSSVYSYYYDSAILMKDFVIGLPDTLYLGLGGAPYQQFMWGATAYYGNPFQQQGYTGFGGLDLKTCQLSSSNPEVASVNQYTQLTTLSLGNTTITAICDGIKRSQTVKVEQGTLIGLTIPYPFDAYQKGNSNNYFVIQAYDQNGTKYDITPYATYSYSNDILCIDPINEKADALSLGYTVITATYAGVSSSLPVIVVGDSDPNVPSSYFSGNTQSTMANQSFPAGTTIHPQLLAYMIDKGSDLDVTGQATFVLDDPSKGQINPDNSITLTKPGTVTIIAIYKNDYHKLFVKVLPSEAEGIRFQFPAYFLQVGDSLNTGLSEIYSDGSSINITFKAHYHVASQQIASIDDHGIVKGISPGSTEIEAVYPGANGSETTKATVTVFPADGSSNGSGGGGGGGLDTEAPQWPTASTISTSQIGTTEATLNWSVANDNIGVTGYKLYSVTGNTYATATALLTPILTYQLFGLTPDKTYVYTVQAMDAAGNWSSYGPSVTFHTQKNVPTVSGLGGGGGGGGGISRPVPDANGKMTYDVQPGHVDMLIDLGNDAKKELTLDATANQHLDITIVSFGADIVQKATDKGKPIIIIANDVKLTFPINALTVANQNDTVKFEVKSEDAPELSDFTAVSPVLEFSLAEKDTFITTFNTPIGATFHYDPSKVKDASNLGVYWLDETTNTWTNMGGKVNGDGTITVILSHFSKYAVLEKTAAAPAPSGTSSTAVGVKKFTDIQGHWAQKDIEQLVSNQIIDGMSDESFQPDNNMTRGQFVTVLKKALNLPVQATTKSFADVAADSWYRDAVYAAYAANIVDGTSDNTFAPEAVVTREQLAVMMVNTYLNVTGKKLSGIVVAQPVNYVDSRDISDWAQQYVAVATTLGLLNGIDDTHFAPAQYTTRAQVVTVVVRTLKQINETK
jgi:hypothetical protein